MLNSRCTAKIGGTFYMAVSCNLLLIEVGAEYPNTAQWRWFCEGLTWCKPICSLPALVNYCWVTSDPQTYWPKTINSYYLIVLVGRKSRSSWAVSHQGLQSSEDCLGLKYLFPSSLLCLLLESCISLLGGFYRRLPPEWVIQKREELTKAEATVSLQSWKRHIIFSTIFYALGTMWEVTIQGCEYLEVAIIRGNLGDWLSHCPLVDWLWERSSFNIAKDWHGKGVRGGGKEEADTKNVWNKGCGRCGRASSYSYAGCALHYFGRFHLRRPFGALSGGEHSLFSVEVWHGRDFTAVTSSSCRNGPDGAGSWVCGSRSQCRSGAAQWGGLTGVCELLALVWHSLLLLKKPVEVGIVWVAQEILAPFGDGYMTRYAGRAVRLNGFFPS